MNKIELIKHVADQTGHSQEVVGRIVEATSRAIHKHLSNGEDVRIAGLGTFTVKHRDAYDGHHPKTGEKIRVAAKNTPQFKPHADLKAAVG